MNVLFQELISSLKFSFQEKESTIKYEPYYFNGIPIPYDIEYKENIYINYNEIDLSWKLDNKNMNMDKNKIIFKVEIRKENEEFEKVYEGENSNCLIKNLNNNTNYEIHICSNFNGINGFWSNIKKIKTDIDSNILLNCPKKKEFIEKIYNWSNCKNMQLLYRGTKDGMYSKNFHEKCDNKGATIT